ncbi:hypothetical protein ACIPY6_03070 [Streptomyces sp. NPDC090054]|uniref:hypothetical protein n=1 Tax=Streptomyces sp. NPDC090054 TaxID=3365933 RepID=UPI0038147931
MTFTFKPRPGGRLRFDTTTAADGPHVWFSVTNTRGEHAAVFVPVANVEEVVAGLREIARQQDGQASPLISTATLTSALRQAGDLVAEYTGNAVDSSAQMLRRLAEGTRRPNDPLLHGAPDRRQLTEAEHDAAWHAVEGTASEDGADPSSVLAAVLWTLNIDPPPLSGAPLTDKLKARAAAVLPPGARITAQALRETEEAGA